MRKELLCVLGGLMAACAVQAQQGQADFPQQPYYQGGLQPVQMAPGAGYGGYGSYYYPNNNYGYTPSYPANYGYTPSYPANYGYGMNYGYGAGVPSGGAVPSGAGVQVPADLPAAPVADTSAPVVDQPVATRGPSGPNKTFWIEGDYLLGSVQRQPLRFPLVTVGSVNDNIPGALGQPNTSVVFGPNNLGTGLTSGFRAEAGMFLDSGRVFSLDVGGFFLNPRDINASFQSDANGFPVIARPYINTVGSELRAEQSSFPPMFTGGTTVNAHSNLYGFEANARCNGCLGGRWYADILTGFRYLRLDESLNIGDNIAPIGDNNVLFLGQTVPSTDTLIDQDSFVTRNTFYGANLGARLRWQYDWLSFSAYGKVALGATQQRVSINGSTTLIDPAGNQTAVGGILALPSNIGTYTRTVLGVVPEAGVSVGVQPINHVRLKFGYSLLYWNAVARPGDQIDPRLNRTAVPGDSTFGQPGGAGPNPIFTFHDQGLRVQNLTAGVEFFY
jgi:hypothetical protein